MTTPVYLALYRGRKEIHRPFDLLARFSDWLTRKITKGPYSHCEVAIPAGFNMYFCYSSSVRDGGVRLKAMELPADKWDLVEVDDVTEQQVKDLYRRTRGCKYDWLGAIGVVLKIRQNQKRWFCSEWVAAALGFALPHLYSPNDLAEIFKE